MLTDQVKSVYFIGIGGIGVGGLAEWLFHKGYIVLGSDQKANTMTGHLTDLGISVHIGHSAQKMAAVDLVVYSSAIPSTNTELTYARENAIPCVTRGQLLAHIFNQQDGICIIGTHGKTTTSCIAALMLEHAGYQPSYVVGGIINGYASAVKLGDGDCFVAEADESDGSFLLMRPRIALVTNIDRDHLNHYGGSYDNLLQAFRDFLCRLPYDGIAIVNIDDPGVAVILPQLTCKVLTYGTSSAADVVIQQRQLQAMHSSFQLQIAGHTVAVDLNIPGYHNIANAAANAALAHYLKIPRSQLQTAMANFPGVARRFQLRGEVCLGHAKVTVVEDYGHHPRAILASLQAARQAWSEGRVVLVFQPHRYTRTQELLDEFAEVLCQADYLILLEVYAAGESVINGGTTGALFERLKRHRGQDISFIDRAEELAAKLTSIIRPGDIILLQGAGSVGSWAGDVLQSIEGLVGAS